MNAVIGVFSSGEYKYKDGSKVWCNKDQPHHFRTSRTSMIGFKKLLVDWEFNKKAVQFDEETLDLSVEGKPVLSVNAKDGELKTHWLNSEWGNWQELLDSDKFKELVKNGNDSLKIAKELRAKGKGKGKPE